MSMSADYRSGEVWVSQSPRELAHGLGLQNPVPAEDFARWGSVYVGGQIAFAYGHVFDVEGLFVSVEDRGLDVWGRLPHPPEQDRLEMLVQYDDDAAQVPALREQVRALEEKVAVLDGMRPELLRLLADPGARETLERVLREMKRRS